MEQFYTFSLFTGPLRLGLFVCFLTLLYRLTAPQSRSVTNSGYASFIFFICAVVLLCFVLIQINSFDRFTILSLIFGFIFWAALDIHPDTSISKQLRKQKEGILLFFIRFSDSNSSVWEWFKKRISGKIKNASVAKKKIQKEYLITYGIPLVLFIVTYLVRVWFLYFDSYSLSDIWYDDLMMVKETGRQKWFISQDRMPGEYALISLYQQITKISSPLALQSFGLIQSSLLSVSIFWSISKITQTRWFPGLIAALGFIFAYSFFLLDITTIIQHRSVFLALAISFPVFVMVLRPETLTEFKTGYFLKMLVLFSGVAFIDLFVTLIVLPLFLLFAFISMPSDNRKFFFRALSAYTISLAVVLCIHGVVTYSEGRSFAEFLFSNLYAVSSYTYLPHLILPYSEFVVNTQILMFINLLLVLPLWLRNKKNYYPLMAFSLLFVSLAFLINSKNLFFDRDLLNQVMTVCIPVSLGMLFWIICSWIKVFLRLTQEIPVPYILFLGLIPIGLLIYMQQQNPLQLTKRNGAIEHVLSTYNAIENSHLPFSYAVVNNDESAPFSLDSHYTINYKYFNTRYLDLDADYVKHRMDKEFLRENPDLILPKTIFVFLYSSEAILNIKNGINKEDQILARENLSVLRKRNRQVRLYFENEHVQVFEIINEPNQSRIQDLLSNSNSRDVL